MERSVELFVAVTSVIIGLSHILRADDWVDAFRQLRSRGRPGAFVNGGLSLACGAAIVAGHGSWGWPGGVVTGFGWLMVAKGGLCFLAPDLALRSMERGRSERSFIYAGTVLLLFGGFVFYCLWHAFPAAPNRG